MAKKIIYLHIPKVGGTSQRAMFNELYGLDRVHWHGDGDRGQESTVVGGHWPISQYKFQSESLYLALVREPISRAVSLYSYYVRPEYAADRTIEARSRELQREYWLDKGMDSSSVIRSLENCAEFRWQVRNEQCRYLSRKRPNFKDALETMCSEELVVGDLEQCIRFNEYLAQLLAWRPIQESKNNSSTIGSHEEILQEFGLESLLSELVEEDLKLYRHITEAHNGLYINLSEGFVVAPEWRLDLQG